MKKITFLFLSILFISCGNNKETRAGTIDLKDLDIKIQKIEKADITSADSLKTRSDELILPLQERSVQSMSTTVTQSTYMTGMSQAMQGGSQFGDYMVYGGRTLRIYNLNTKTLDFTVVTGLALDADNHFNSMAFSKEFHTTGDTFPILYMASNSVKNLGGFTFGSAIYGVRIYMSGSSMKAEIVHTITIISTSWIDISMDDINDFLWLRINVGENHRNVKIARPLSVNGDITVKLNSTTILSDFKTLREPLGRSSGQGLLFYDKKLYMTTGTGSQSGRERIMIINTDTEKMEHIVDLRASGLTGEPEFIIRYDDRFFIAYRNGKLYEIAFKK